MKPGSRDRSYPILITGQELKELKELTYMMAEAFGLDGRVERYQGKRPIGFYRWDLDCLEDVLSISVDELRGEVGEASTDNLASWLRDVGRSAFGSPYEPEDPYVAAAGGAYASFGPDDDVEVEVDPLSDLGPAEEGSA